MLITQSYWGVPGPPCLRVFAYSPPFNRLKGWVVLSTPWIAVSLETPLFWHATRLPYLKVKGSPPYRMLLFYSHTTCAKLNQCQHWRSFLPELYFWQWMCSRYWIKHVDLNRQTSVICEEQLGQIASHVVAHSRLSLSEELGRQQKLGAIPES